MSKIIGRPKTFNKEEALKKAMYFFWEHGYESAGLNDLLNVMGIKKSSFYQTFGSKEELFKESLECYTQNAVTYFETLKNTYGAKGALIQVMHFLLQEIQNNTETKGCLVMNSGSECSAKFGHLNPLVKAKFKTFQKLFMRFVLEAQEQGDISKESSAFVITTVYQSIINGASTMVKAGAGEKEVAILLEQVKNVLR